MKHATSDEHPMRRSDDQAPQPVVVNSMVGATKRLADHALALLFGVFLATLVSIPSTLWAGSRWVGRVETQLESIAGQLGELREDLETYKLTDAQRSQALAEAVASIDKTTARIVANQENLQARVDRLERVDDETHRQN